MDYVVTSIKENSPKKLFLSIFATYTCLRKKSICMSSKNKHDFFTSNDRIPAYYSAKHNTKLNKYIYIYNRIAGRYDMPFLTDFI